MKLYTLHFPIHEVAPYINWLYFFHAWGFPARLGSIAKVHGCEACRLNWLSGFKPSERARAQEAARLYDDATRRLGLADAKYQTHATVALADANSDGDDIIVYRDNGEACRLPFLRSQQPDANGLCLCISDFVRPVSSNGSSDTKVKGSMNSTNIASVNSTNNTSENGIGSDSSNGTYKDTGTRDCIGIFACCTDRRMEEEEADEYNHLLNQTLADRLAEATAEYLHEKVRKELWGFAPNEALSVEELFQEKYQGKRPAVGYPSMPDQSLNFLLSGLLPFGDIGISLTETGAMRPHASTSGLILSHPATVHFSVGYVGDDQLRDYAHRRGMSIEEMRKYIK